MDEREKNKLGARCMIRGKKQETNIFAYTA